MKLRCYRIACCMVAAAMLFFSCTSMLAKKPVLKNTRWVCIQEQFVADAGTMTETYTLEFTSGKDCLWKEKWVLPAHPAMYLNADGTVGTVPGSSSEYALPATWQYRRGQLTLEFEDGSGKQLRYTEGRFICPSSDGGEMVFEKVSGTSGAGI